MSLGATITKHQALYNRNPFSKFTSYTSKIKMELPVVFPESLSSRQLTLIIFAQTFTLIVRPLASIPHYKDNNYNVLLFYLMTLVHPVKTSSLNIVS